MLCIGYVLKQNDQPHNEGITDLQEDGAVNYKRAARAIGLQDRGGQQASWGWRATREVRAATKGG